MYKTIFYTVLITCIICGALWFTLGRNNTTNILRAFDKFDRDMEELEQSSSQFSSDFAGYEGSMAGLGTSSSNLGIEIRGIRKDFQSETRDLGTEYGQIQSRFQYFSDGINSIEESVRQIVILSRDYSDILYEYRRRGQLDEKTD